ncbi:MAG: hypothetical protein OXG65_10835 [Chloroflexi bacterium]|nr:hypothetical protein [Chloroflexota bacterium]
MRREHLRGIGGHLLLLLTIIVGVTIGMSLYLFGLTIVRSAGLLPRADDNQNKNIVIVEDSIEWKLISQTNDETRLSFRFTVRNPTNEEALVDVYNLRILFLDAEGYALARYNWSDDFTVPANGAYTYNAPHDLQRGLGDQVFFIEVLGVRST